MADEFPSIAKIVWRTEKVKNVRKERRRRDVFEVKAMVAFGRNGDGGKKDRKIERGEDCK